MSYVQAADTQVLSNTRRTQTGPLHAFGIWPGIALSASIAGLAFALHHVPGLASLSPMILALVIGIAFHNLVGTPALAREGIKFGLRRILRLAIVLLGLQLTAAQVVELGPVGIAVIAATLAATFMLTTWFGRLVGVDRKLTELIAAGTSICGASAVITTNTVTEAHDEDVAYAIACVTVFGSLSMFLYPLLPGLLHLDAHAYGLWAGASIHEIAQAVAAAFQNSQRAGEFGTIAKLSRVMLLAPVVLILGWLAERRRARTGGSQPSGRAPVPWFILGFVGMAGINSVIAIPPEAKAWIVTTTVFLMSVVLAARGLETDIGKLKAKGVRPLLLGAASTVFISGFSLALVKSVL